MPLPMSTGRRVRAFTSLSTSGKARSRRCEGCWTSTLRTRQHGESWRCSWREMRRPRSRRARGIAVRNACWDGDRYDADDLTCVAVGTGRRKREVLEALELLESKRPGWESRKKHMQEDGCALPSSCVHRADEKLTPPVRAQTRRTRRARAGSATPRTRSGRCARSCWPRATSTSR